MTEVDMKSLNESIEKIGRNFHEFKQENDAKIAELSKKGVADPLLTEKIEKLNKAIGDLSSEKDKIVVRLKQIACAVDVGDLAPDSAEEAEAKGMYRDWLVDGINSKSHAQSEFFVSKFIPKKDEKGRIERKAMSVISDPDGGYMVTADLSGRMVKKIFETSDIRRVCAVQTIGTDALEGMYDLNEAGFGWVGETGARTSTSTPQIGKYRIPVHEMYANAPITQTLLDDANLNVEQWLADKLADKFARAENAAFVGGTTNDRPRGFLTYAAGTTLPGTVEQVVSGAAANATADGLMNLIYSLKTAYRTRAQFGMNRLTVADLRKLKDSQNRYLWEPGLNGATQQSILGFQINEFNDMPVPAANALAICFADWAEFYQVVDRVGVRILRDPYTNKPYVQFYATKRTGGDVTNFEAGKIQKFST